MMHHTFLARRIHAPNTPSGSSTWNMIHLRVAASLLHVPHSPSGSSTWNMQHLTVPARCLHEKCRRPEVAVSAVRCRHARCLTFLVPSVHLQPACGRRPLASRQVLLTMEDVRADTDSRQHAQRLPLSLGTWWEISRCRQLTVIRQVTTPCSHSVQTIDYSVHDDQRRDQTVSRRSTTWCE